MGTISQAQYLKMAPSNMLRYFESRVKTDLIGDQTKDLLDKTRNKNAHFLLLNCSGGITIVRNMMTPITNI